MTSINKVSYPTLQRFDSYVEYSGDLHSRDHGSIMSAFIAKRHKQHRSITNQDKLKAGIGAIAGTVIPMFFMMKKQGRPVEGVKNSIVKSLKSLQNPMKLKYELSDMVILSGSSVVGGVVAGMFGEDKNTQKNKAKEGIFQFLNASIPAWVVGGGLKLCESSKNFNNIPGKIMTLVAGLLVGMYGAASLSNVVCDPKDRIPDRKLTLLDCMVNVDDALGVLVLAKFPFASKLHVERALPFIYSYCGYRAGKTN